MRPCCLTGHPNVTTPKGTLQKIANLPCYVVGDDESTNNKVLLIAPDIFGLSSHLKTLSDSFSLLGIKVCAVDYFSGTGVTPALLEALLPLVTVPAGKAKRTFFQKLYLFFMVLFYLPYILYHIVPFLMRHGKKTHAKKTQGLIDIANEFVKQNKQVYLVGYCYGGGISVNLATQDSPFSAIAEAHGNVALEQVKSLKKPMLFCCAENDHSFPEQRIVEAEKIIEEKYPKVTLTILTSFAFSL